MVKGLKENALVKWTGEKGMQAWNGATHLPEKTAAKAVEIGVRTKRRIYIHLIMPDHDIGVGPLRLRWGDTSNTPVYYYNGEHPSVQEAFGIINVAVPLKCEGLMVPATKTYKVLRNGFAGFPQLLLQFRDGMKSLSGDEVIEMVPGGKAVDILRQTNGRVPIWHIWMSGMDDFNVARMAGGRDPEADSKSAAEITLDDVVEMLRYHLREPSNGKLDVAPDHILQALEMVTAKSPELRKRLIDVPKQHLEFQKQLIMNPDLIALLFSSLVTTPKDEFKGLVRNLRMGKIQTWSQFLNAIDDLDHLETIGSGPAILPAMIRSGFNITPDPERLSEKDMEIPTSLFVSYFGLEFILDYLEGYKARVVPKFKEAAENAVLTQENVMEVVNIGMKQRAGGYKTQGEEMQRQEYKIQRAARQQAREQSEKLAEEMRVQTSPRSEASGRRTPINPRGLPSGTIEGEYTEEK